MTKEEMYPNQQVYHINRRETGNIRRISTEDTTSVVVEFDSGEAEVSICFLVPDIRSGDFA